MSILALYHFYREYGLYIYITVAVIAANIQVLKAVKFSYFPEPIALGTILFASTYLCTDILAEHHGSNVARRAVILSTLGMLLMTVFMTTTLGWTPLDPETCEATHQVFCDSHNAMMTIFTPTVSIFAASIIAYVISQYTDIWIFTGLKKLMSGRILWLRTNVSTILSALVDNTIFSMLAWIVLAPMPISIETVIMTHIVGTLFLRAGLSFLNTPFIYITSYLSNPKS
ncbi:MAG: queuosine precursor transporter [Alphaproteobacteria bacterium]